MGSFLVESTTILGIDLELVIQRVSIVVDCFLRFITHVETLFAKLLFNLFHTKFLIIATLRHHHKSQHVKGRDKINPLMTHQKPKGV